MTNWRNVQGAKFSKKPTAEMMAEIFATGKCVIPRNVSVKGQSKLRSERTALAQVEYDRDWLVEYILFYLKPFFEYLKWSDAQKLIGQANQLRKKGEGE